MQQITDKKEIGLGIIGFGGFALFAVQHIMQIPRVNLVGFAETSNLPALAAGKRFDAIHFGELNDFFNSDEIDLVYIATPPFLHYEQSMRSLEAGKHVICEKPLAIKKEHALEMVETARRKGLLMVVNLMQRYNPLYSKIKALIESKTLGEVLHAYFENYASDEFLAPDHWFWDKKKSGGIFIEHGVHFFDMFEGWFGKGVITSAQSNLRPGTQFEEQVQCQAIYNDTILANFYHGFTQPSRMDRQELRILFEKGEVTLFEWVPYKLIINALADEFSTKELMKICPGATLSINSFFLDHHRNISYRHKKGDIYQSITLKYGFDFNKMNIYGDIVRLLFEDQIDYIRNREHQRIITEENALNSLLYAIKAEELVSASGKVTG